MITIEQMRLALGLSASASDIDVQAAWNAVSLASTAEIVTTDEVKEYVRVDGDYEDATLNILIDAAIEAVTAHADGWDGQEPVPARIKLAVLTHVARAFDSRGDDADLPPSAVRLINPFRRLEI